MSGEKIVTGVKAGGSADAGHSVMFVLQFSDVTEQAYLCQAANYTRLLTALQGYGAMAAKARAAQPGQLVDIATPVRMTNATRTGQFADRSIVFEFGTDLGFPMQLSMSPDLVRRTIALLQAELQRQPPKAKGTN